MKIALAQYNFHIGHFQYNTSLIIEGVRKAREQGADLVVFSELAVCGYPTGDFLEFDGFIRQCQNALEKIAIHCEGIAAIVGAPTLNPNPKGKRLYNSAYFIQHGQVKQVYHKALLPDYDIFDEYRYFEPANSFSCVNFMGRKIALTVCEDIWNLYENPLYLTDPMAELAKENPDLMINISASPFAWSRCLERKKMITGNARKYGLPLFYINQVGAHTELLFDGGSMVVNPAGEIIEEFTPFQEDLRIVSLDKALTRDGQKLEQQQAPEQKMELILQALVMGIRDYFRKMGFQKAILGLSGGLDSALTLVLAAKALGSDNVRAVLMPGAFSSDHSVKDAEDLARNLGVAYDIIPIHEPVKAFENTLEPWFQDLPFGIAEENMQARARALILMALANKFGYVLLNTSNKSEAAVGYGTLYGDMCGGLAVIGDIYKTEVFELARYINCDQEIIPQNTILKPPSAELRPDQKDSDSLPEYDLLDQILYAYIENQKGLDELIRMGFDKALVERVLKLVNTNEYKRYQTPPVLRVSAKAFGPGRKMPIVAYYPL